MHKLIALYHPPTDIAQFRRHLVSVHLPIVRRFPGLRTLQYSVEPAFATATPSYAAIVECEFDSEATMQAALASPAGAEAAADVPNYASAGVTILTFAVQSL